VTVTVSVDVLLSVLTSPGVATVTVFVPEPTAACVMFTQIQPIRQAVC
jgi:hypothetical protein